MIKVSLEAQRASQFVAQGKALPKYKNGGNRFDARKQVSLDSASSDWANQDANMLFKTGDYLFSIPVHGKTDDYTITVRIDRFLDRLNEALKAKQFSVPTFQQVLMNSMNNDQLKCCCSCDDYKYRWAHSSTLADNNAGRPEGRPSPITNPNNVQGCCKHILYTFSNKLWATKVARNLFNYIIDIWKNKRQLFDRIIRPALNDITDEKILSKPEKPKEQPVQQKQAQDTATTKPDGQNTVASQVAESGAHESFDAPDMLTLAKKQFGITYKPALAGFICPDGDMLDFSFEGYRDKDHRDIAQIYPDEVKFDTNSAYMADFMHKTGCIRVDYESGSINIDITHEPTKQQYERLTSFIRRDNQVSLDLDDGSKTIYGAFWDDPKDLSPARIIGIIKDYFKSGKLPKAADEAINSFYAGNTQFDDDQEFALSVCREIGADVGPYVTPENTPDQIEELGQAYKNGLPVEKLKELSNPSLSHRVIRIIAEAYTKHRIDLSPYKTFAADALEQIVRGKLLGVPLDKIALKGFNGRQIEQLVRAYKMSPDIYNKICDRSISYNKMRDIIAGRK